MSNYPPGVSGFEPQIVGVREDEVTIEVVCEAEPDGQYCGFVGDVVATRQFIAEYADTAIVIDLWGCPRCGTPHDDEREITL